MNRCALGRESAGLLPARLIAKVGALQALARKLAEHGDELQVVGMVMQRFELLTKQGRFDPAEAVIDEALARVKALRRR